MKRPVVNPVMAARLKAARKARDLTQATLAERIGIGQSGIAEAESGRVAKPDNLAVIVKALGVTEEWVMGEGTNVVPTPVAAAAPRPAPNAGAPEYASMVPGPGIPVLGHSAGGDNGRFIMNGQTITHVFCPPILAGVSGAYATYVHGDSMVPRYYAGETVWLHPYLPVKRDDFVVAQVRSERWAEGDPPDAYVKQFVSRTQRRGLVLRQLNPPEGESELMEFNDDDVFSVHKIVFAGIT